MSGINRQIHGRNGVLSEVKRELSWDEPIAQTIALYERIAAESRK